MKKKLTSLIATLFLIFSFQGVLAHDWSGKSEDLEKNFKKLFRSYKDLRRSYNRDDIADAYEKFNQNLQSILDFETSANQEETEIFEQGTNRLANAIESLGESIKNGDNLNVIKNKIQALLELRKEYHKKLSVRD